MSLSSSLGPPSNSAFNLPGTLGPLVSAPGSPSRLMGPSPSPFPMLPLSSQLHSGPVGTQGSSVIPGGATIGGLNRLGPPSGIEKTRMQETSNLFPDISQNVSKEIEDEANGYFQRIYNHPPHPTLSIDEVLDMLKKFQDSSIKRERDVFHCMLRNLFEEYRFFPQVIGPCRLTIESYVFANVFSILKLNKKLNAIKLDYIKRQKIYRRIFSFERNTVNI
jgi:CCR4-NOT transcription complex subunit 1